MMLRWNGPMNSEIDVRLLQYQGKWLQNITNSLQDCVELLRDIEIRNKNPNLIRQRLMLLRDECDTATLFLREVTNETCGKDLYRYRRERTASKTTTIPSENNAP